MPKKKKKPLRGVVPGSSKFAAVYDRVVGSSSCNGVSGRSSASKRVVAPPLVPKAVAADAGSLSSDLSLVEAASAVLLPDPPPPLSANVSTVVGSTTGVETSEISMAKRDVSSSSYAQSTVSETDLGISSRVSLVPSGSTKPIIAASVMAVASVSSDKVPVDSREEKDPQDSGCRSSDVGTDSWVNMVKGSSKTLSKKGSAFTLPSGELCVKIPNGVIERNKKSWDFFILGQFYSDPPSQGTVHNIVNGIWSRQFRDISVSKMEGNAFLFRIPNSFTRSRVLNQRLWQIDGQTMFVAKWEPGMVPVKPELSSAPIWLELRNVPLQFFHEEGLEQIASLVGHPKCLHPSTANKTNIEVAKVFTIIDPRRPLPEAVNVQFESGEIRRVLVSSPWMPPVCSHCKEIGHSLRHCKEAPITCRACNSVTHEADACPKQNDIGAKKRRNQRNRRRSKTPVPSSVPAKDLVKRAGLPSQEWQVKANPSQASEKSVVGSGAAASTIPQGGLGEGATLLLPGESSKSENTCVVSVTTSAACSPPNSSPASEAADDSSDILSSDPEEERFIKVLSKRQQKLQRGKGLKPSL